MLARSTVLKLAKEFVSDLKSHGLAPKRAILFGSYAKGLANEHSDIDLAIWADQFSGCRPQDIDLIIPAKKKFTHLLEVHTFHSTETENTNPFVGEIVRTGISINIE
jgi:uncharacterized protein